MCQPIQKGHRKLLVLKLAGCLVVSAILVNTAFAAPVFKSPAHAKRWLKTYYLKPRPERVPAAIKYMSASGMLDKKHAISPLFGFMSGVFQQNPGKVDAIVQHLDSLKERHLGVVVFGLWYSGLPDSQERVEALFARHPRLSKVFAFLTKNAPRPLTELPLEKGEWILDALWGQFMATGSPEPVRRVIASLDWLQDKKEMNKYFVASAARFSLTANAGQHRKVREIIAVELPLQSPAIQSILEDILSKAQKKKK